MKEVQKRKQIIFHQPKKEKRKSLMRSLRSSKKRKKCEKKLQIFQNAHSSRTKIIHKSYVCAVLCCKCSWLRFLNLRMLCERFFYILFRFSFVYLSFLLNVVCKRRLQRDSAFFFRFACSSSGSLLVLFYYYWNATLHYFVSNNREQTIIWVKEEEEAETKRVKKKHHVYTIIYCSKELNTYWCLVLLFWIYKENFVHSIYGSLNAVYNHYKNTSIWKKLHEMRQCDTTTKQNIYKQHTLEWNE